MSLPLASSPADRRVSRPLEKAARRVASALTTRLAIACSGGVDSTALVLAAAEAFRRGEASPFIVLHVDHRARPGSEKDAEAVAELCAMVAAPFVRLSVARAAVGEVGEARLRALRYDTLADAVRRLGLAGVVTAHTFDDQVETVLMRLLSGSGPGALAGMVSETDLPTQYGALRVVRPFLDLRRSDCEAIVAAARITPVFDPTNADTCYRRNALRLEILPRLRKHFPGFESALLRTCALAAADADFLDAIAQTAAETCVVREHGRVAIDRGWMRREHPALVRRVIRREIEALIAGDARELTFERVEAVRRAAHGRSGATIEAPGGVRARVLRDRVELARVEDERDGVG